MAFCPLHVYDVYASIGEWHEVHTGLVVSSLMVYSLASLILTRKAHLSFFPSFVPQVLKRYTLFLEKRFEPLNTNFDYL